MKEKIILSFIAIALGLFVAGGAFYIYQSAKTVKEPIKQQIQKIQPTKTPQSSNFLIIEKPKDEELFNKRIITVTGKTIPNSVVIVSTAASDQVVKPTANGDFTLTQNINDGVNVINITAIFPNGEEQSILRTVTSTTEEF